MRVSYNKLWKLLIDKNMKKGELREAIGASKSTFAKLGKNENVTLPVLLDICEYLQCDFGDIMEAISEGKEDYNERENFSDR
jgi:DNA-binding Xre family transcriptional regulator